MLNVLRLFFVLLLSLRLRNRYSASFELLLNQELDVHFELVNGLGDVQSVDVEVKLVLSQRGKLDSGIPKSLNKLQAKLVD